MKHVLVLSLAALLYLPFALMSQDGTKGWRGIVPLHSTKDDVLRILGITGENPDLSDLRVGADRVSIALSDESCEVEEWRRWRVPTGTVTDIRIMPGVRQTIDNLNLDISNYTKIPTDVFGFVRYRSNEAGLEIEVSKETGAIVSLWFFPGAAGDKLACPQRKIASVGMRPCAHTGLLFDPTGMFTPQRNYSEELKIFCIGVESVKQGRLLTLRGRVISLTGTSFAMIDLRQDGERLTFQTETIHGISYAFEGRLLWKYQTAGQSPTAGLVGDVRRMKSGGTTSRSAVPFSFRRECLADR